MIRQTYLFSLLVVLSAGMCAGQHKGCFPNKTSDPTACMVAPEDPCASREWDHNGKCVAEPAPLKCGKYEHVAYQTLCEEGQTCIVGSETHVIHPARCVPDLHTVTEKEWQELMGRLKRLEAR